MREFVTAIVMYVVAVGAVDRPAIGASRPGDGRPMNVVFILADDLGWCDTSLYGSRFYETPNVDRLGARGMMFTNAYSASPLCSPSRSAIMTGLWPARTGITRPSCHVEEVILEKDVWSHADPQWKTIDARTVTRLKLEHPGRLPEASRLCDGAFRQVAPWARALRPAAPRL